MKKIVAISVLLVSLTAAVFAQDGWTFGLSATHVSDLVWATKMTGKSETTASTAAGGGKSTQEFGDYTKGAFHFFNPRINGDGNNSPAGAKTPDNRLLFTVKHAGENHEVYADIRMDKWETFRSIWSFLESGAEDWWVKGNVGPFNGQIGSAGYGGFVDTRADWNGWYDGNNLNRFGVYRAGANFLVGNDFRTWEQWGKCLGLGFSFGDYRISLGHRLDPNFDWEKNPPADGSNTGNVNNGNMAIKSESSANASFMFSGRPTDAISFDVFYSIMGSDTDTSGWDVTSINVVDYIPAPSATQSPYTNIWGNIIGAYVGINAIENLGLSIGYTANFNVYEKVGYVPFTAAVGTDPSARSFTTPFYSGINIHANYTGIDKIWIGFNNNISLAGVKGKEIKADNSHNELVVDLDGKALDKDKSQDWFFWDTRLVAKFDLVENLGLNLTIGNQLGVRTDKNTASGVDSTDTKTENRFCVSANAQYGIGAVTVGAGLFFQVESKVRNQENVSGSGSKFKGNTDVVSFGIPILFKVAF